LLAGIGVLGATLLLAELAPEGAPTEPSYETVVTAPPPRSRDGSFTLGARQTPLPGAAGDPGRSLENAPGVGRLAAGTEGLVLWGAAPQESRILLDGVEIPALFHFGGWRSVISAEGLRSATVVPGAFTADLGRAVGGIVKLDSAGPATDARHAWLAVDPIDTQIGVSGPVGDRVGFLATGRVGHLDQLAGMLGSREQRALMPLPAYADAFGKLAIDVGDGRSITVEAIGATDERRLELDPGNPIGRLTETRARSFARTIVRYLETDGNEVTSAMVFAGPDHAVLDQQLGLVPVSLQASSWSAGTRLSHGIATGNHWLEVGIDGQLAIADCSRTGSLTNPAREGDRTVFGEPPAGPVGSDTWHPVLANVAPYVLAELRWQRLELRPGLRLDGQLVSSDRVLPPTGLTPRAGFSRTYWSVEPRLGVKLTATAWLEVGAAAGVHHQAPDATDLSAVFGSSMLGPSRALDGVLSAGAHRAAWTIDTAAFARKLDDLPVRNPDAQAPPGRSLVPSGRGRSYGVEIAARHECSARTYCAFVAYTLSRSERRGPDDAGWRLLDFDQTHVLTAALGYRGARWYGGARLRYATGMPRTPVVGAFFDSAAGQSRPVLGNLDSSRLPAFAELDVRVERKWQRRWGSIAVSAEIVNVTDRANAEAIVYSGDYSRHAYVTGLPLLVLAGLRLEI
jgi:hypothetical protein